VRLIANTRERVEKERRQKLKKGVKETELGDLTEEQDKAVIKAFAEMEHRRVNLEKREAAQKRREAEQQEKQQQQTVEMFKRERSWAEEDRREHRVGNWRDFQKGGKRRKEMDAQGRKEERVRGSFLCVWRERDGYRSDSNWCLPCIYRLVRRSLVLQRTISTRRAGNERRQEEERRTK
jgi:hypothetical protein